MCHIFVNCVVCCGKVWADTVTVYYPLKLTELKRNEPFWTNKLHNSSLDACLRSSVSLLCSYKGLFSKCNDLKYRYCPSAANNYRCLYSEAVNNTFNHSDSELCFISTASCFCWTFHYSVFTVSVFIGDHCPVHHGFKVAL